MAESDKTWPFMGADIEIYEEVDSEVGIIKPRRIRINGQEIYTLAGTGIEVNPISFGKDVVSVTITGIICRSLTFGQRQKSGDA